MGSRQISEAFEKVLEASGDLNLTPVAAKNLNASEIIV